MIEKIKKIDWHADWGGSSPLLDISFAPELYFYGMERKFGKKYSSVLVIIKGGIAQGYLPEMEYEKLGKYLADRIRTVENAEKWSAEFIGLADEMYSIIGLAPDKFLKKWKISKRIYGDFGAYAEATKTVFDVAGKELSHRTRNILAASRKYCENFYSQSTKTYQKAISKMIKPTGYGTEDMLYMTRNELINFIGTKKVPPIETLRGRRTYCGIYFAGRKMIFLDKKDVQDIEDFWLGSKRYEQISGTVAFRGKAIGKCRVIRDFRGARIKTGEILVTGMTDPNYVPLMKKAGAIVTDGGGLLCHAAIVARELKKPCIIGTKIATQALHDGDLVEVDAESGVVKILEKIGREADY